MLTVLVTLPLGGILTTLTATSLLSHSGHLFHAGETEKVDLDWEENSNKSWTVTLRSFTNQFNKERRTLERANNTKNFESNNVFREHHAAGTYAHNAPPTTNTDYNAAMEYAAAMELKSTAQEGCILELEDALDGRTVVTLPPELAASATTATTGASAAAEEEQHCCR